MIQNKIGDVNYELQKELVNNFFNGYYYITFDNKEEIKEFMKFISFFDLRFKDEQSNGFNKIKEVVWQFSKNLHHHQLEYSFIKGYWKVNDINIEELKFCQIADYVKKMNDGIKAINNLTNSFEDNSNKDLFKMLKLMQNEITKKFEKDYKNGNIDFFTNFDVFEEEFEKKINDYLQANNFRGDKQ